MGNPAASRLKQSSGEKQALSRVRRGTILVYASVATLALVAILVMSVDWGRVELAKSEMRASIDAAARAACAYLPSDTSSARTAAISMAATNKVDGNPLVLQSQDVEFGYWDASSKSFSTTAPSVNAVQITAYRTAGRSNPIPLVFARVLGKSSQDVWLSQVTMIVPGSGNGFIGLSSISVKNNLFVASYNSGTNPSPSHAANNANGALQSNGAIDGGNNNTLWGMAVVGPSGSVSGITASNGTIYSSSAVSSVSSPTWSPGTNPGNLSRNYASSGTKTLAGGTYWFTSLTVTGSLNFSAAATLYVNGDVDLDGSLTAYGSQPKNLKIYVIGTRTFGNASSNSIDVTADIEAPGSTFVAKNNAVVRGRMIFDAIDVKNNADFYYDEAFGSAGGGTTYATVR